ncbi:CaiB/BaiF CoA transferase family protein [Nocardia asteroides]|uniref:CaiB/BaiF CoA transferase family protein n=1 Tax=Nocardia asteroides TaxID=1824 RepID=UPI001E365441|nr:CaiB/BaiF CoA-transferase family protein [Nocardia asteroides]UGT55162.1 CoA transferase [Nocardia asteroides]
MTSPSIHDRGPLAGIRVVELAGLGPAPHAALLLADLGADVVRVQRPGLLSAPAERPQLRGRTVVEANLKDPAEVENVLGLIERADVLLEGFRPGVTERLGLGPDVALKHNARLVYGRMTGWGQYGPLADRAGHDINYISLTGVLHSIGRKGERPVAPLNMVGDFGGGSMFLVFGILAALIERQTSGEGQVVDAAMIDGTLALSHMVWGMRGVGTWSDERGTNLLDTGMAYYETYETADGKYMAVGAIEPQFYAELLRGLDLDQAQLTEQSDPNSQDELKKVFADRFRSKSRDEWTAIFEGTDACCTPVLTLSEAAANEHIVARTGLIEVDGVVQHAPAPRFSRTPSGTPTPAPSEATSISRIWVSE